MRRTAWHVRVGAVVLGWLAVLLVGAGLAVTGHEVPTWLLVHVLLLGAVSNAIFIWTMHFAAALQRLPDDGGRRGEVARLALLNAGAITFLVGGSRRSWPIVVAAAALVAVAAGWQSAILFQRSRRALPSRFSITIGYYVAAGLSLVAGVTIAAVIGRVGHDTPAHARLELAHASANLLGWVGLTVLGTVLTLWPTMLRTQVVDGAVRDARRALPALVVAVVAVVGGAIVGSWIVVVVAALGYLVGIGTVGRALVLEAIRKPPRTYATLSVLAALAWFAASVGWFAVIVATSDGWIAAAENADRLGAAMLLGFAAQIVVGALSFLIPVVLGGGPTAARATNAELDRLGRTRAILVNACLIALVVQAPKPVGIVAILGILVALATFLVLAIRAVAIGRRAASIVVAP